MSPNRRIQRRREHAGGPRRSLAESGAYDTPNNGQNRRGSLSTSSSADGATADDDDTPLSPSTPNYFNYAPFSEQDPNLDGDEAGGDSDVEGEEIDEHADAALLRLQHDAEEASETFFSTTEVAGLVGGERVPYDRLTTELKIHKVPADWHPPQYKEGLPAFNSVDNPGDWDEMVYQPKFHSKTGRYMHHALPTGITPVPKDEAYRRFQAW